MSDCLLGRHCLCVCTQCFMCASVRVDSSVGGHWGFSWVVSSENVFASETPRSGLMFFSAAVSLRWAERLAQSYFTCQTLKKDQREPVGDALWVTAAHPPPLSQERHGQMHHLL